MKPDQAVLAVVDALNKTDVGYFLSGSFASNFYGIPRSTQDADFVIVDVSPRTMCELRSSLGAEFTFDPQMSFETMTGTRKHEIRVHAFEFIIELFQLSDDPHDQERYQRRVAVTLFGREVYLPTPEDVIITKLRWLRRKDYDDIQNVIAVQHNIDWRYVDSWCDQHGTREVLDEIRANLP